MPSNYDVLAKHSAKQADESSNPSHHRSPLLLKFFPSSIKPSTVPEHIKPVLFCLFSELYMIRRTQSQVGRVESIWKNNVYTCHYWYSLMREILNPVCCITVAGLLSQQVHGWNCLYMFVIMSTTVIYPLLGWSCQPMVYWSCWLTGIISANREHM